jgi:hypothetical protein
MVTGWLTRYPGISLRIEKKAIEIYNRIFPAVSSRKSWVSYIGLLRSLRVQQAYGVYMILTYAVVTNLTLGLSLSSEAAAVWNAFRFCPFNMINPIKTVIMNSVT